jgi:prepilin-type N-terminal cleavage/methylation domain-containing protein
MLAGLRRAVALPRRSLAATPDAGFTLVEILVATMLIGIVMTALTSFFVGTVSITSQQAGRQAAVQLAAAATERVRALSGSAVVVGRDRASTESQWDDPVAGVAPYLADMQQTWDKDAESPAGESAPLPTSARSVTLNGVSYAQHWYVGKCWQRPDGGDCAAAELADYIVFYRVVVAVTWSDRNCTDSECSYVTSTMVSAAPTEPVFNANDTAQPAKVTNPGNRVGEVQVPDSLQLVATGGAPPLIWSGSGLPPGLEIASNGLITGTPLTAGTYAVTVSATDAFNLVGSAGFTWTINALPALTPPPNQTTARNTAVNLAIQVSGGTGPLTWTATGLPAKLSINPSTGVITGTPDTAAPAKTVEVTVEDTFGKKASTQFTWTIT